MSAVSERSPCFGELMTGLDIQTYVAGERLNKRFSYFNMTDEEYFPLPKSFVGAQLNPQAVPIEGLKSSIVWRPDQLQSHSAYVGDVLELYSLQVFGITSTPRDKELDQAAFDDLAEKWKVEIGGQSSLSRITSNENYLTIIAYGWKAVPFILRDLKKSAYPWFAALSVITKEKGIGLQYPGQFRKIADAWIQWGRDKRLV